MGSFAFKLEHEDGTPADPPSFKTSVPTWRPGDAIPLGQGRSLRVIDTRQESEDDLVLIVDDYDDRPSLRAEARAE